MAYSTTLFHMQERVRGYREACAKNGLEVREHWIRKLSYDHVKENMREHINVVTKGNDPVDALFFTTNTLAVNGVRALDANQIKISRDLGVVVFDQSEVFEFFYAPLSFVKQPIDTMAKRAVRILVDQINGKTVPVQQINLEGILMLRGSSRKSS